MNSAQFIILTEVYGADIHRWPIECLIPAAEVIGLNLPEVKYALTQAASLDALFDSEHVSTQPNLQADRLLFDRIIATAPKPKTGYWQAWAGWLSWYSLVGAGLAGAVAGAFFVSILTSDMLPENVDGNGALAGVTAEYVYDAQDWS